MLQNLYANYDECLNRKKIDEVGTLYFQKGQRSSSPWSHNASLKHVSDHYLATQPYIYTEIKMDDVSALPPIVQN